MTQNSPSSRRAALVSRAAALLLGAASVSLASAPRSAHAQGSVEALLYSTMPSTAQHQPDMVMDGNDKTYFRSVYGMSGGDDFLVLLSSAISVKSVKVTTGDEEGGDLLTQGAIDASADGETFTPAGTFDAKGIGTADLGGKMVRAIKIHLNRRRGGIPSLVIREISIDSPTKISHVQMGPGRGWADLSQAPDVAAWAAKAESQMEEFWPDTAALLYTDRFITPNMVNVVYRTGPGVTDVAATGGGVMTVNTAWCRAHPEDTGLTVHEMAHVVQSMSAYDPVWLIEGTADYIRWIKFEPENYKTRLNPAKATYHDSYRTTASFLAWCELHYDSELVTKLNKATRFGRFRIEMFKEYCGKDVDTLWAEFIAAYKADPEHITTPPMAAADIPRVLPTVKSSVPVDLAAAFDAPGVVNDGTSVGAGLDGEGYAYSSSQLNAEKLTGNVTFKLGPAGKANVLTCKGNTIALPSGAYSGLWLLGTGIEGNQMGQKLIVTYTDGSVETLTQNFSDWYQPQRFVGESRAVRMPYRLGGNGEKDERTFYVYRYGFPLNAAKTVKSLTLPDDHYIKLLGVTLTN